MKQRAAYPKQVLVKLPGEADDNDLASQATKVQAGRLREQIKAVRAGGKVVRVAGSCRRFSHTSPRRHMPSNTDSDGRAARKARAERSVARATTEPSLNVPADTDRTVLRATTPGRPHRRPCRHGPRAELCRIHRPEDA